MDSLQATGVDEIACLVDFGVDVESVLRSLEFLDRMKDLHQSRERQVAETQIAGFNEQL